MTRSQQASALATAVLEGEDPKDFLRHQADAERQRLGIKPVAKFEWSDHGIDNSQYFQGAGTAYTDFDEACLGVGDNPYEAADDALNMAAQGGWEVEGIANEFPTEPSVADEYPDGAEDMYYHIVLRLKERKRGPNEALESPKGFFKREFKPSTWPEIPRWSKVRSSFNKDQEFRRAYYDVERKQYIAPETEGGEPTWKPYTRRFGLPHTKFYRNKKRREHWLEYYNTEILRWDSVGNLIVHNGGYFRQMTRERINQFLTHGWQIHTKKGEWYWFNNDWPDNIRNRIWSDVSARCEPSFPWWIPYHNGDTITHDGKLEFGDAHKRGGVAYPEGDLKLPGQPMLKPPVGTLSPPRRKRDRYDPNQLTLQMEGRYLKSLLRRRRIQGKLDKMKEVKRRQRELEDIDKPDKRKRKLNLH